MPWCDDCDRFLSPNTVNSDGTCPTCGSKLARPSAIKRARRGRGSSPDALAANAELKDSTIADEAGAPTTDQEAAGHGPPWHFWVLLVALVIYLGYRLIQGIVWVSGKL